MSATVQERLIVLTRRTDHNPSKTIRLSDPSVPKRKMYVTAESEKPKHNHYSACTASGAAGSEHGKGGSNDLDHGSGQYAVRKYFRADHDLSDV